jgi:hypothetical protein
VKGLTGPKRFQRSYMRRILPFVIVALSFSTAAWAGSPQSTRATTPTPAGTPAAPAVAPVSVTPSASQATTAPGAFAPQQSARAGQSPGQARATTPPAPAVATPAPTPAAQTTPAAPASSPMAWSSWQNVKLEFTITDTFGSTPSKKTVSMLVVDHGTGRIRSSMQVKVMQDAQNYSYAPISINIDATVTLSPGLRAAAGQRAGLPGTDQIMLGLTVQYTPDVSYQQTSGNTKPASLDESLNLVVQDGKPTLVSQSADPQGDRKVTLEVTATIVK